MEQPLWFKQQEARWQALIMALTKTVMYIYVEFTGLLKSRKSEDSVKYVAENFMTLIKADKVFAYFKKGEF